MFESASVIRCSVRPKAGREGSPPGWAAGPAFAQAGYRVPRAWRRRPDREPLRDRPPAAIANSRDRPGNYGNTPPSRVTTGHSRLPTTPPQSAPRSPATPVVWRPCLPPIARPRPVPDVAHRSAWHNRGHRRVVGGRRAVPAAGLRDSSAAPARRCCGKRLGRPPSSCHSLRPRTIGGDRPLTSVTSYR